MAPRNRPHKKRDSLRSKESQKPNVEERQQRYQEVLQDVMHSRPLPHHRVDMTPALGISDLGQIEFEVVVSTFEDPVSAEEIRQYSRQRLKKLLGPKCPKDILMHQQIEKLVDKAVRGKLSNAVALIKKLGVASILLTGMFKDNQSYRKAYVGLSAAVVNHALSTYLLLKSGLYIDALICIRAAFENHWLLQYIGFDNMRADKWLSGKVIPPSEVRKGHPESDSLRAIYSELSEAAHLTSGSTQMYCKNIAELEGFFLGTAEPNLNSVYVFMYLGFCILSMFTLVSEWMEVHMEDYEHDDLIVEFMNDCLEKSSDLIIEAIMAVEEFEPTS